MACSYCGSTEHNIQTCGSVRRCGHCGGRGHDRRNCPALAQFFTASSDKSVRIEDCSVRQLRKLCTRGSNCLVHLYWPEREKYFEENLARLKAKGHWLFVATTGHGVDGPQRRTINFLVADDEFARGYESTAEARGVRHGVMVRRSAIADFSNPLGYDFAEVCVGHPNAHGVYTADDYWRFDIGKYRYGVMHDLQFATVVRLATPDGVAARRIRIPGESIVAWW